MLQYLDAELETRTGLSKQTRGIDADALPLGGHLKAAAEQQKVRHTQAQHQMDVSGTRWA
jgi:hypothetical protein